MIVLPHSFIAPETGTRTARRMVAENLLEIARAVENDGKSLSPQGQREIVEVIRNFAQEVHP